MQKRIFIFLSAFLISTVLVGCLNISDSTTRDSKTEAEDTETSAETESGGKPGWYLISESPIISDNDLSVHPDGGPGSSHMGDRFTDVHQGIIEKPDYELTIERIFEQGDVSATGFVRIVWEDPADVLFSGQKAAVSADIDLISSWSIANMVVAFEEIEVKPGYSSPTVIRFQTTEGRNIPRGASFTGEVTMEKAIPEGNQGEQRAILISFGNGYGYRYIYEWRE